MTNHAAQASSDLQIGMLGEEVGHLGLDRLDQQGARPIAQHLGERVGERPWLKQLKPLRLHQVWRSAAASEPDVDGSDRDRDERVGQPSTPWLVQPDAAVRADQGGTATRIALRPHDPGTGEEIEKSEVVKGYEYDRGQFVTFSAEELRALDVENSKVIRGGGAAGLR